MFTPEIAARFWSRTLPLRTTLRGGTWALPINGKVEIKSINENKLSLNFLEQYIDLLPFPNRAPPESEIRS